MSNFFNFKDKICKVLKSGVVYRFKCGSCNAAYYGKTKRHLKVRVSEHMGVSPLTGKKVNTGFQSSAIKIVVCDHRVSLDDFSILPIFSFWNIKKVYLSSGTTRYSIKPYRQFHCTLN